MFPDSDKKSCGVESGNEATKKVTHKPTSRARHFSVAKTFPPPKKPLLHLFLVGLHQLTIRKFMFCYRLH